MGDWRTDLIRGVGGQPSAATIAFLTGWQRKEGGATNNAASFNWLNRTDRGFPTINKVGVVAYPNYQTGVARTAQLIQSGYPSIANALRAGQISYSDPAVQADLNRWLSGKRTPGLTPYVRSVASLAGANVGAGVAPGAAAASAPAPTAQAPSLLSRVMPVIAAIQARRAARRSGQRPDIAPLVSALMQARQTQSVAPPTQNAMIGGAAGTSPTTTGGFLQAPTQWTGTHVTDNLGWGTKTAEDIMAAPGTAVGAPESGTIERLGSAQGGESVYFRGDSGKTYWLGHVGNSLPAGTRVQRGQPITYISADHPRPHLHIDVR